MAATRRPPSFGRAVLLCLSLSVHAAAGSPPSATSAGGDASVPLRMMIEDACVHGRSDRAAGVRRVVALMGQRCGFRVAAEGASDAAAVLHVGIEGEALALEFQDGTRYYGGAAIHGRLTLRKGDSTHVRTFEGRLEPSRHALRMGPQHPPLRPDPQDAPWYLAFWDSDFVSSLVDTIAQAFEQSREGLLIELLRVEDPYTRWHAAEMLRRLGDKAKQPLLKALGSENRDRRHKLLEALAHLRPQWALGDLLRITEEDSDFGGLAACAAVQIDRRACIPVFARLLQHDSVARRQLGAAGLADTDDPSIIPLLVEALAVPRNSFVRRALLQLGKPAFEPLCRALTHDSEEVRTGAADVLREMGDPRAIEPLAAAFAEWQNLSEAKHAIWALEKFGDRGLAALAQAARGKSAEVRIEVAKRLHDRSVPETSDVLTAWLGDPSDEVRYWAASALGKAKDPRATEALLGAFRADASRHVRGTAACSLGQIGEPIAVHALLKAFSDPTCDIKASVTWALSEVGSENAAQALLRALTPASQEPDARSWHGLIHAAGRLKDKRAVGPLIRMLRSRRGENVEAAADALGDLGDARAVDPLLALLKEARPRAENPAGASAQAACIDALAKLAPAKAAEAMINMLQVSDNYTPTHDGPPLPLHKSRDFAAMWALGDIGEVAVPQLRRALKHPSARVRAYAVSFLAQHGEEAAFGPAVELLKDSDFQNRAFAIGALSDLGGAAALPHLVDVLRNWRDWGLIDNLALTEAAYALGKLRDPRGVEALIQVLESDPETNLKRAVIVALGESGDARAVQPLLRLVKDREGFWLSEAASALANLRAVRAVETFVANLKDWDSGWRKASADALGKIGDPLAVGPLTQLLGDRVSAVRASAAKALGAIADPSALPSLERLAETEREESVREQAR